MSFLSNVLIHFGEIVLTCLLDLGMITIPAHQSVGVCMRENSQFLHVLEFGLYALHQGNGYPTWSCQGKRHGPFLQFDSVLPLHALEQLEQETAGLGY